MALFSSNDASNLGSINAKVQDFFSIPSLPNIVAEWSALIPLVCHLASYRQNHLLAGEIALNDRLSIGLCPRLGVLAGVASLLRKGPDFLDQVSAKGGEGKRVWDVNWGSVFPCANGAASTFLAKYALEDVRAAIQMPTTAILGNTSSSDGDESLGGITSRVSSGSRSPCSSQRIDKESIPTQNENKNPQTGTSSIIPSRKEETRTQSTASSTIPIPHRYQTLHVLDFSFSTHRASWRSKIATFFSSAAFEATAFVFLVGIVLLLCILGSYGTASVLLCGAITQLLCRLLPVQHPGGYLHNNEAHDACMLVGIHQNASVWYLYVGNRGAVDWLLNKTMISFPSRGKSLARWFKFAHTLQLGGMTFSAAQKGWDGVSLLILISINWALRWRFKPIHIARRWLETENLVVRAKTFEFTGRTPMLGAIQQWNGGEKTVWMDEILSSCPRRAVWLSSLGVNSSKVVGDSLSQFDRKWVDLNLSLSSQAAEVLKREIEALRKDRADC
jgi:hypothetical protein